VLLAHLSDLHLRDESDAVEFERQLDCIVAERPDHLVITGDLLDRWNPPLLERALDALDSRACLDPETLTIIHGNHDLASSGGHPRVPRDLWRLAMRFWDPPPVLRQRRERFYRSVSARRAGVASLPPFRKDLARGITLAALDSVPFPWLPFAVESGGISLQHARGAIAERDASWLASQSAGTLVVLIHHYPLQAGAFRWRYGRWRRGSRPGWLSRADRLAVNVPMEIPENDRERLWNAVADCGAAAILCGHVHRARLEHHRGVAVGLNGQSGADWAGRTIAFYRIEGRSVTAEYRTISCFAPAGS
jgi:UDP-2,3-diacylglucosamine pyrophosphatase LpxH